MPSAARPWLRGPLFDVAGLAFCWLPVYLWVVFGLGIGAEVFGVAPIGPWEARESLALAILVVLGLTWVHRHYTFVLVYGDGDTFRERRAAYLLAPLALFGVAALALSTERTLALGPLRISPAGALLVTSGLWNVWHTVQQRYGILRAYAGRAGHGLETRAHARRDRALLWGGVVALAVLLPWARAETFASHPSARRLHAQLAPVVEHPAYLAAVGVALLGFAAIALRWVMHERRAAVDRGPRWIFLASTFALLAVFVVHGPIVGYLCFGAAHAIEYVFFVHHFGARRWGGAEAPGRERRSVAAVFLGRPWLFAPPLVGSLVFLYVVARAGRGTEAYVAYYVGTSMLHFLYDGWIWKLRQPRVARSLALAR